MDWESLAARANGQNDLVKSVIASKLKDTQARLSNRRERAKNLKRQRKKELEADLSGLSVNIGSLTVTYDDYLKVLASIVDEKELYRFKKKADVEGQRLEIPEITATDINNIHEYYGGNAGHQ